MMQFSRLGRNVQATGCLKACGLFPKLKPWSVVVPDGTCLLARVLSTQLEW